MWCLWKTVGRSGAEGQVIEYGAYQAYIYLLDPIKQSSSAICAFEQSTNHCENIAHTSQDRAHFAGETPFHKGNLHITRQPTFHKITLMEFALNTNNIL